MNVNPSTSRHKSRGLLRVDPERRFPSPPSKARLSAVERVNKNEVQDLAQDGRDILLPQKEQQDEPGP